MWLAKLHFDIIVLKLVVACKMNGTTETEYWLYETKQNITKG